MSHSLTRGYEVVRKPVSTWPGEYFLLFTWRVIFGSGIKFDTPFSIDFMIACLKLWLVYHSAWSVIELVVPAGLTLRAVPPYTEVPNDE